MKPDIPTLHKPDILILQRQAGSRGFGSHSRVNRISNPALAKFIELAASPYHSNSL